MTDDEPSEEEKNEKPQAESRAQSASRQKAKQKHFATTGKMEVIVKSKSKLKRVIKKRDNSDVTN